MSQSQNKAIVDKLLTGVSSAYIPEGCVADLLLPKIKSKQYTGLLGGYGTSHLRIENTVVGGKGKFRVVEAITRTTTSFEIEGHGLQGILTKRDYANLEDPFDVEKDEVMGISTILMLEKEKGLADTLGNTAVITQNVTLSGTSQFNDYANSDIISVVRAGKLAVKAGCGAPPDTMIMDWDVAEVVRYHPQLLDVLGFKYGKPGGLTNEDLAKAFNVKKVIVPSCQYNTAKEGQTASLANVWGKNIILAVLPDTAQKYQISLGYEVRLEGSQPRKTYKWDENNPPESKAILVEDEYDMLISNASAAYLIKNAIA